MKSAAGIILLKWNEELGQVALRCCTRPENKSVRCVFLSVRRSKGVTDFWRQLPRHSQTQMKSFFNNLNTLDQS